jgi:hypothetical protein
MIDRNVVCGIPYLGGHSIPPSEYRISIQVYQEDLERHSESPILSHKLLQITDCDC